MEKSDFSPAFRRKTARIARQARCRGLVWLADPVSDQDVRVANLPAEQGLVRVN